MTDNRLEILRIDTARDDVHAALNALHERLSPRGDVVSEASRQRTIDVFGAPLSPIEVVERICREVHAEGLPAVLRYTHKLDGAELTADTIRVPADELRKAHEAAEPEFLATVRRVRENIMQFQTAILHRDVETRPAPGVILRQRYSPVRRAGLCVPGGAAAYPSSVLMTAVPAQAAGVEQLAVVAPPTPFGSFNPDILATCHELGIDEIYRTGGAQAVAALAYGTEAIPRVDAVVGPGNLFVALAKKYVYGDVQIDSIAGPSEVVVIADQTTRPDFTAADLLSQAEHSPGAGILITWSRNVLNQTYKQLCLQVARLSRSELTAQSLEAFGALVLVRDPDEAADITNRIAPEHLHIATDDAMNLVEKFKNAGAIFLGNYTPVALGDYVAGPSHVLPTGGTARFASGLTANDFMRGNSVLAFDRTAMNRVAKDVQLLATKEQLTAHRHSIEIREA